MACMIAGALMILCGGAFLATDEFAVGGFMLLLGTLFSVAGYEYRDGWQNRIEHLCRDCSAVTQPRRGKDDAQLCGKCGSADTVPMDSPFANAMVNQELARLEGTWREIDDSRIVGEEMQ